MEVSAYKCEHCGSIYENKKDYDECVSKCIDRVRFNKSLQIIEGKYRSLIEIEFNRDYRDELINDKVEKKFCFSMDDAVTGLSIKDLDNLIEMLKSAKDEYLKLAIGKLVGCIDFESGVK